MKPINRLVIQYDFKKFWSEIRVNDSNEIIKTSKKNELDQRRFKKKKDNDWFINIGLEV